MGLPQYATLLKWREPSFLLFGFYCHHPTEAAVLLKQLLNTAKVTDYWEKLVLSFSSVKALAVKSISKAQQSPKDQYDRRTNSG